MFSRRRCRDKLGPNCNLRQPVCVLGGNRAPRQRQFPGASTFQVYARTTDRLLFSLTGLIQDAKLRPVPLKGNDAVVFVLLRKVWTSQTGKENDQ